MERISLNMLPTVPPVKWSKFVKDYPEYSIAIDGFVVGMPRFDKTKKMSTFDHHEGVSRLGTRSTCAQILMAIRQGLFDCYKNDIGLIANVYANDCDQDVCVSWFLLNNSTLVSGAVNPLINRLVYMEDMLDATAGAYPFPPSLPTLEHFAWIFEPYSIFRMNGGLYKKDKDSYSMVVLEVENRIKSHIMGNGKGIVLNTKYERIHTGTGWTMVNEIGAQARTAMFSDGIKAFVSVRQIESGRYAYVLGRMSHYINFDIITIMKKMNLEENILDGDLWGGSETIGGSPRIKGSKITPDELFKIIEEVQKSGK